MASPLVVQSLIASLTSSPVTNLVSVGIKALTEYAAESAEERSKAIRAGIKDPIKELREACLLKISGVRSRASLCIRDPGLQQKFWCLLMEQTIRAIEANSTSDLEVVSARTEQVNAA